MRVFKWTPDFRPSEESPIVPVWVSFPLLPLYVVVNHSYLFSLASVAGRPLRMDEATSAGRRFSVARVLVEVDLRRELQERLWVGVDEEGFWQPIEYENVPSFCTACRHLGHSASGCHVGHSDKQVAAVELHPMVHSAPNLPPQKATVRTEEVHVQASKQEWVEVKGSRRIKNGASTSTRQEPAKEVGNAIVQVEKEGVPATVAVHNVGTNVGDVEALTAPAEVEKTGDTVVTNTSGEEQPFEKVLRLSRTDYRVASDCSEDSEWDEDRLHSYGGGTEFLSDDDLGMGRGRGFKMKGKKKTFRYRP